MRKVRRQCVLPTRRVRVVLTAVIVIRTGYFKVETKHVKAPLTTEEARALIDKSDLP